jgi:hypothetical protein
MAMIPNACTTLARDFRCAQELSKCCYNRQAAGRSEHAKWNPGTARKHALCHKRRFLQFTIDTHTRNDFHSCLSAASAPTHRQLNQYTLCCITGPCIAGPCIAGAQVYCTLRALRRQGPWCHTHCPRLFYMFSSRSFSSYIVLSSISPASRELCVSAPEKTQISSGYVRLYCP